MKEFKGTKEEWKVYENIVFADDYFQTHICHLPETYDNDIREANAKLIASAPELLEALQYISKILKSPGLIDARDLRRISDLAIQKALGNENQ